MLSLLSRSIISKSSLRTIYSRKTSDVAIQHLSKIPNTKADYFTFASSIITTIGTIGYFSYHAHAQTTSTFDYDKIHMILL
mgnify:CR=1 FL=1